MIAAELIERARDADLLATAERIGCKLTKATTAEHVGPCPKCGGRDRFGVNLKRQLWNCRHCDDGGAGAISLVQHALGCDFPAAIAFLARDDVSQNVATLVAKPAEPDKSDNRGLARALWRRHQPIVEGCPVRRYPRARGYDGQIPVTLRSLLARGQNPPCMIAAFGMAGEPEPGVLTIADDEVRAVHLTRLKPDGSGKAGTAADKVTIGQGALGAPIVLAPPNDGLGLAICEGVEDALSVYAATGLGAWAAGAAGRMPALADAVLGYVDCVTIFGHRDEAGERGARDLAARLIERGFETILKFLEPAP